MVVLDQNLRRSSKIVVDASNPVFKNWLISGQFGTLKSLNKHDDNVREESDFFSLFARPKLSKKIIIRFIRLPKWKTDEIL